jgi:hypothetical protein
MPAQVSHLLFAEEALQAAFGEESRELLRGEGNLYRFGAQGPDFFYHNQRSMPSGLKYGVSIHREGYGRLLASMVGELHHLGRKLGPEGAALLAPLRAYLLGFTTHPFLDREAHPFIIYFSGWVRPDDPSTQRYFRAHIFLERILDVLLLQRRRGMDIRSLDLPGLLNCGPALPYSIVKTLIKSLHATYPKAHYKSRDRLRIENAYRDSMGFYEFIDPMHPEYRRYAYTRDMQSGSDRRRLALFHPLEVPEGIDFLNLRKSPWCHPCNRDWVYTHSFMELYETALGRAVPALRRMAAIIDGGGDVAEVEELVGNESLNTGLGRERSCRVRFSDPLPLPELLDRMYARLGEDLRAPACG